MTKVKETKEYTIFKKRSGRFAVTNAQKQPIKADEKTKILLAEKLIKQSKAKAKEAPAEAAAS